MSVLVCSATYFGCCVSFMFHSEVLLSSEARIVTYVNKQGDRSEHSLEEVLQTGENSLDTVPLSIVCKWFTMLSSSPRTDRKDIAKRLKYTKDIMYRLINIQAR